MIRNIRHRGLKRLLLRGDASGVGSEYRDRIQDIPTLLNTAATPSDLNIPRYRLHQLRGDLKDYWSMTVSANWRIIFRIENGDIYDVDLVDYH